MRKRNVLFLCAGNFARSQMAEAFVRRYAGDRLNVFSAGVEPTEIHPLTVAVMEEIGFNLLGHSAKGARQFMRDPMLHYVIVVCEYAQDHCPRLFPGALNRLYWPFEDPAAFEGTEEEKLAKFRQVRDQVHAKVKEWLAELAAQDAVPIG